MIKININHFSMVSFFLFSAWMFVTIPVKSDHLLMDKDREGISSYTNWEEVRNSSGVKTYVRWILYKNGKKTRERKGEMQVNCSLEEALRTLTDASETKKWMSGISENYILKKSTPQEWYTYTLYDIPWPFNKRDLVSLYKVESPGNQKSLIQINSMAEYIPHHSGIERLKDYTAIWTITANGPQKVQIVFSAISDTPPLFPKYIQDPVIGGVFHNNLVRLKERLSVKD